MTHRFREQARSHRGFVVNAIPESNSEKMWERACSRWRRHSQHHRKLPRRIRERARLPLGCEAAISFFGTICRAPICESDQPIPRSYDCCTNVSRTAKPIRRLPNNHCCTRWAEGER